MNRRDDSRDKHQQADMAHQGRRREMGQTGMAQTRSIDSPAIAAEAADGVAALIARIERAPIPGGADAPGAPGWAPAGYDATDIRILEWIASHGRRRDKPARLAA